MKAKEIKGTVRILTGVVFLALLMPTFAFAQKDDKTKDEKKEAKQNEKDEKRLDKQVRKYEETLGKAVEKYSKHVEFRDDVDFEYRNVQRKHAELAFEIN